MTNSQVEAARRVMQRRRATVKLDSTSDGAAEVFTPYLTANAATRGTPVRITKETPVTEVTRLFNESLRSIL